MKQEVPSYIIKYIDCQQEGHQGQKVNLICLNPQCHENSLICSLCTPKHRGHAYKPIKIYLDELYRKYQGGDNEHKQDIDELERRKQLLLYNLKVCVEKISEAFMKMEEDILFTYDKIKNQIHENESRKSKFAQFYLSMIKDNYGDPHFQVKNYLYKEEIKILTDQNIFDKLVTSVEKQVKNVRGNFVNLSDLNQKVEEKKEDDGKKGQFLLPKNIIKENDIYTQSLIPVGSPNLCLFNLDVGQWTGKLRLQVTKMALGAKLTLGVMRKQDYEKANNQFKDTISCMYVDSFGKSKGTQYNHVGAIVLNQVVDCFLKKNNFRILCKNNNAIINLNDKNYYFFFAMEGDCKIKITYPYFK